VDRRTHLRLAQSLTPLGQVLRALGNVAML
jgi:hypothetical protein